MVIHKAGGQNGEFKFMDIPNSFEEMHLAIKLLLMIQVLFM